MCIEMFIITSVFCNVDFQVRRHRSYLRGCFIFASICLTMT